MAKKVVIPDDSLTDDNKPIKKKRSMCCTCCIVLLVVILIILAAAFGAGWYFGDMLTKEYLDMSLGDTLGVVGDLYWADDKKVVTNGYTNEDLDGFYKEIKRNILLKEDADVDFQSALDKAVLNFLNSDNVDNADTARTFNEGESFDEDNAADNGEGETSVMDVFTDMIAEALNRENIDIERLNSYDENNPDTDTYIFNLKDKQLAAFFGSVLKTVLNNADKVDGLKEYASMVKLGDVASLKQIVFSAQKTDGEEIKAALANITVWIGLQDAAGQALTSILEEQGIGWAAPLACGLGNMLLPKNLYVNVGIPLYGDADPVISFNDMNDAERERAYKLVNGILAVSDGESKTVTEMLDEFAESIKPYLETAAQNMNFGAVGEGTIKMDLLDTVTKMASESFDGDPITKSDFIYLLQALFSDPEIQLDNLEPYRYTNRYLVDGKDVYIKGGDASKTPIDYEQEFIKEIENKYALKFKDGAKLNDVLAMLGVSFGDSDAEQGSTELLDLIDAKAFNELLERDIKDIELNVTDRMLAAALSPQMDNYITGGESDFAGIQLSLDALTFIKHANKPNNLYALLAVEADLSGLFGSFGDNDLVTRLVTGLMPEKLVLTVTIDITRNREAGTSPGPVDFILNSCANTDRALSVLEKLAPSLDLKSMSADIESMLNDMLDQLYKTLNVRLVPSSAVKTDGEWTGNTGALVLPDIFTVITDTVLIDNGGERVVLPEELKDVLRAINDTSSVVVTPGIAESYSGFIDQVVDKYYLNPNNGETIATFAELTSFMSDFNTNKLRITGSDPSVKYLAYDTRSVSELEPVMSSSELGALLVEQMGAGVEQYTVKRVTTDTDLLTVVLSVAVGDLLPDDVKFLLTCDELFVTAAVDMSIVVGTGTAEDPYRYDVSVKINGMNDKTYGDTLKIVRFFNSEFDIESQVEEFGEIIYEQMQKINSSFTPSGDSVENIPVNNDTNFFRFTSDGLVLNDFYTFLANKMKLESAGDTTSEVLKRALQGMYERSTVDGLANPDNYVRSNVIVNAGDKNWSGGSIAAGKTYSDTEFNAYIAKGVEGMGSVKIEQTVVLSKTDTSAAAKNVRTWVSGKLSSDIALDDNSDYMLVSVSMIMNDFMQSDNDKSQGFFPASVLATIVYKYDAGSFTNAGIIFNDLGAQEYNVLQQLMGLSADTDDKDKVNIMTVDDATVTILNGITAAMNVELLPQYGGVGIGSIYTASK